MLLDGTNDFSWQSAKASHAALLCRMKQREISDWSQTNTIDRVRCANSQRHSVAYNSVNNGQKRLQNPCLVSTIMMVHVLTHNIMKCHQRVLL